MSLYDEHELPVPAKAPAHHHIGQNLDDLSVFELDERIALLTQEIERLTQARAAKHASQNAAHALFSSPPSS